MLNEGLGSWPARRARIAPDKTAVIFRERAWNYAQVHERTNRLANGMRRLGVEKGSRVAYLGRNHPALLETLFATGALGAVYVPLNFRLTAQELRFIVEDAGVDVLVWGADMTDTIAELQQISAIEHWVAVGGEESEYERLITAENPDPIDTPTALEDACMIQYTSGTSGRPKGVVLSHRNVVWNCFNVLVDIDLAGDEVTLAAAPLFHTGALNHTFIPTFTKGGTTLVMDAFDPEAALDLISKHRATFMFGVPAMFLAMADSARWAATDLTSVRTLVCAGAPVPRSLIETYHRRGLNFCQAYGLTETSPGALMLRADDSLSRPGSAGTPHFFTDVRVVDVQNADVPAGEVGEVVVRGPNVMQGYWQLQEATQATLGGDGWLHTGDAAVVDEDGYVYIVDRIKDMIISGGENIYPAEVEQAIYAHPDIAECAVVGVPDPRWGEVGYAVLVLRDGATATADDVLESLQGRLARYKIPKMAETIEALPRNASGKVIKSRIRSMLSEPQTTNGTP
jgi:fatty-acyl-CoA synthase